MSNKFKAARRIEETIWTDDDTRVKRGRLTRPQGRPGKIKPLFSVIAEKLPLRALRDVEAHMRLQGHLTNGVYVLHDSMGAPRYIGRGKVFSRIRARARLYPMELVYFSFYILESKVHEREIETLLIRGAANMLEFNDRKRRVGIEPGRVKDFEPGTEFYMRQDKRR